MKTFLFTIILFAHCAAIFAQQPTQTIRGKVTDEASGAPLGFASVMVLNTNPLLGAQTDENGNFSIKNVPVGRYDIKTQILGYEPVISKEIQVSSSKETYLQITMKESVTAIDEVVIKAKTNKQESLNKMANVSSRMLSVDEAERYAGGFDDPARLASSFAGVASNVANNGIVVRGNAPKSLQWKMEGVEIPNPNHFADMSAFGGGGLTALSSQMLTNSDFFTGAFPAEYNNALSGVFDIFMRSGNNQKREHTLQAGIIGLDVASEGPFKKGGLSSYLFNYRYSTLALVSPLLPPEAQGTKYSDLSFKLNFPTLKAGTFSVWGLGLVDGSGAQAEKDSTKWKYLMHREEQEAKQYMGAGGISHNILLKNNAVLRSTLAATVSGLDFSTRRMDSKLQLQPVNEIKNQNWNYVLSSSITKKFSAKHTNKTGFVFTGFMYDMRLKNAGAPGNPMHTLTDENGSSALISAYTSSSINFSDKLNMTVGLNSQLFTLNNKFTVEPRASVKYRFTDNQFIALGYGLHSRLERLNYYFVRGNMGNNLMNKDMDFTKAHHFVLSYGINLSENILLKVEPYYQHLFSVPVVADSSFSFINLQNQWFFNQSLENSGKGRNYGLDITLEKYLSKGYYFMLTSSLFNSEYLAGDGIWRNTMFNRNYVFNFLVGKEWKSGKNKQNILGLNTRLTYQGGDRYTPVNDTESQLQKRVVFDESKAFSKQVSPSLLVHFTASYKINRQKLSHEIALKVLNATNYSDFYGFRYNYAENTIDEHREAIMIPNLSYKLQF